MDPPLNFNLLMDLLGFDAEDHDFDLDLVPHAAIDDDVYIDMEELFTDAVVDDDLDLEAFLDSVIDSDTTTIPGAVNAEKLMADFTPEKGCDLGDCSICLETLHQGKISRLPCSHLFHKACIFGWFKVRKYTCPLCRIKLQ